MRVKLFVGEPQQVELALNSWLDQHWQRVRAIHGPALQTRYFDEELGVRREDCVAVMVEVLRDTEIRW